MQLYYTWESQSLGSRGPFKEKVNILPQASLKPCATVYLAWELALL